MLKAKLAFAKEKNQKALNNLLQAKLKAKQTEESAKLAAQAKADAEAVQRTSIEHARIAKQRAAEHAEAHVRVVLEVEEAASSKAQIERKSRIMANLHLQLQAEIKLRNRKEAEERA